jgi:D-amino peptidase
MSLGLLLLCGWGGPAAAERPLRVFITVDGEGINGYVGKDQNEPDFGYLRQAMTGEANAAIEGALAAGATKIWVEDEHDFQINREELNPKAVLVSGRPRPLIVLQGIEEGFDAVVLIGAHVSANTLGGLNPHTYNSGRFFDVRWNGQSVSESYMTAAVAGHFGVPVVLVSGDDRAIDEVRRTVDREIAGVVVKHSFGIQSATTTAVSVARQLIKDGVRNALTSKLGKVKPLKLPSPVRVEFQVKDNLIGEGLGLLPHPKLERTSVVGFRYTAADPMEALRMLFFVARYKYEY